MNLKTAARALGVHYQTAYKWVRTGELAAVRIGSRYEVTEAAVEQFLARRHALVDQAPPAPHEARRVGDILPEDFLEELEAMALDPIVTAPAVEGFVARVGAQVLGDTCMVAIQGADGTDRDVVVDHPRADYAAFYNSAVGLSGSAFVSGREIFGATLKQGEPLLLPFVDQAVARRAIQAELRMYAPRYPVFSLVGAPIVVRDVRRGMVVFTRETPTTPYTEDDLRFVVRLAHRTAALVRTADDIAEAWRLRADLMTVVDSALGRRRPGSPFGGDELHDLLYAPGAPGADSRLASVAFSPDDRVLAMNASAERLGGYSAAQLRGRFREHVLLPNSSRAPEMEAHERLRRGEIGFHDSQNPRLRSDGSHMLFAIHRGAVREPDATLACVVGVARPFHLVEADSDAPVSALQPA